MISNVMGPTEETSIGGYAIENLSFTASYHAGGVYSGVLSYNNKLRITLILDKLTNGNANLLKQSMEDAFNEVKEAVLAAAPKDIDVIGPPAVAMKIRIPFSLMFLEFVLALMALVIPILAARSKF